MGGRGFSLLPPRLPRSGTVATMRTLSLRQFIDLAFAMEQWKAIKGKTNPILILRDDFKALFKMSPRLFGADGIGEADLEAMTDGQALIAYAAFTETNDLDYLFQKTKPTKSGGKSSGSSFALALASILRAFPGYCADKAMEEPAQRIFSMLDAISGDENEDAQKWESVDRDSWLRLKERTKQRLAKKREMKNG